MKYAQFCPVAKAAEVIGERWTLLVVRELVSGSTRYAELQRGLGRISPSVLSSRLKTLMEHGVIERVEANTPKGWEYHLTKAGAELAPLIEGIGVWGQRWVRSRMTKEELDVEFLMLHLQRHFDPSAFPRKHAVVAFVFSDLRGPMRRWWLLIDGDRSEVCSQPPGRTEDVTLTCGLRTLAEVFTGDTTVKAALGADLLQVQGPQKVTRNLHRWLCAPPLASVARAASP
jgi:DNA-binding HxlR family transcriptional regulator